MLGSHSTSQHSPTWPPFKHTFHLESNSMHKSLPPPLDSSAVEAGVREVWPGLVHWSQLVERSYCGGHCPRTAPVGGSLGSSCGAAPPRPPRESRHTAGTSDQERLFHNLRCTPLLVFFFTHSILGAPEEGEQYLLLFSLGHTATDGHRQNYFTTSAVTRSFVSFFPILRLGLFYSSVFRMSN